MLSGAKKGARVRLDEDGYDDGERADAPRDSDERDSSRGNGRAGEQDGRRERDAVVEVALSAHVPAHAPMWALVSRSAPKVAPLHCLSQNERSLDWYWVYNVVSSPSAHPPTVEPATDVHCARTTSSQFIFFLLSQADSLTT